MVGVETKLFSILAAEPRPFNIAELTQKTGVDSNLLSTYSFVYPNPCILIVLREITTLLSSF